MVMLVSLEEANDHLRRDTSDDDNDLKLKIQAASQAVLTYIDDRDFITSDGEPDYDSAGNPIVPDPIKAAVLIILGILYADRDGPDFRDGKSAPRVGDIILPRTVHFLLDAYRAPILK